MAQFLIRLAQLNPIVGDVEGNLALCLAAYHQAVADKVDLIVFAETVLSGYPADDLVTRHSFLDALEDAVHRFSGATAGHSTDAIMTTPWRIGQNTYNVGMLISDGKIGSVRAKHQLPNYGVFDDKRIYVSHDLQPCVEWRGQQLGLMICEDIWFSEPGATLLKDNAQVFIVPNASPFTVDKIARRNAAFKDRVHESGLPILYVNQVGGQDDILYDGHSCVIGKDAIVRGVAEGFASTHLDVVCTSDGKAPWQIAEVRNAKTLADPLGQIYAACVLGLRDYVTKNGFKSVLLGLSGGIDSALVAAMAADALGAENVHAYMLPHIYTSQQSLDDAAFLANAAGIKLATLPISAMVEAAEKTLPQVSGTTLENLQSRSRGLLLMALSNETGALLLTTGNKSEMGVGYATLYGDMCGAYNPLKDLYKTQVYALAKWRNAHLPPHGLCDAKVLFSDGVLTRAPSAELRPDQTDQDNLPPYDVLDAILMGLVEDEKSLPQLIKDGFDEATIKRVMALLRMAEFKRRQSAPGPKISRRAFGRDRRYPITNRFKD
jgi:NAD+ synthase